MRQLPHRKTASWGLLCIELGPVAVLPLPGQIAFSFWFGVWSQLQHAANSSGGPSAGRGSGVRSQRSQAARGAKGARGSQVRILLSPDGEWVRQRCRASCNKVRRLWSTRDLTSESLLPHAWPGPGKDAPVRWYEDLVRRRIAYAVPRGAALRSDESHGRMQAAGRFIDSIELPLSATRRSGKANVQCPGARWPAGCVPRRGEDGGSGTGALHGLAGKKDTGRV